MEDNGQHFWQYVHYDSPRFRCPLASFAADGLQSRWHVPSLQTQLGSIDRVLYINLARRTDRRADISRELQKLGIAEDSIMRIAAVDAGECEDTPIVCCARSHIAALEHAMTEDLNGVLILEDDFMLCHSPEETRGRWARFCHMTPHIEIASWAHNCLQLWDWRDRGDGRVWYLQTASAYAVRKAAMRRLRAKYLEAIAQRRPFRHAHDHYERISAVVRVAPCAEHAATVVQ